MQQALSREQLDAIAAAYAADHPGQDGKANGKRERNAAALAWLASRGTKVPVQDVAGGITADSLLIGGASAQASASGEDDADTGAWKPGDTSTAKKTAAALGLAALLAALTGGGGAEASGGGRELPDVAGAMEDGYLNVVSRVLAGWDPEVAADELAGMLEDAVADGAYAEALTVTQITTVAGQAALQWYLSNNVMLAAWSAIPDARVCPACLGNAAADPRPPGIPWPSGHLAPPAHPACRCSLTASGYTPAGQSAVAAGA